MVWIRRILVGLLLLLTAIVLLFGGIIVVDAIFGRSASDYTNITFTGADGVERVGYLATPDGDGPHPAVLLIHEWWGLNDGITELADALAAEAGMSYWQPMLTGAKPPACSPRFVAAHHNTTGADFADVDAAFDHLRGLESVDAERVASMGFCFGGGESLQLGMRQAKPRTDHFILRFRCHRSGFAAPADRRQRCLGHLWRGGSTDFCGGRDRV